jgi:hypothetical protein
LPEVFYHPRALAETWEERANLHAKCVIVDRHTALVILVRGSQAAWFCRNHALAFQSERYPRNRNWANGIAAVIND